MTSVRYAASLERAARPVDLWKRLRGPGTTATGLTASEFVGRGGPAAASSSVAWGPGSSRVGGVALREFASRCAALRTASPDCSAYFQVALRRVVAPKRALHAQFLRLRRASRAATVARISGRLRGSSLERRVQSIASCQALSALHPSVSGLPLRARELRLESARSQSRNLRLQ